RCGDAGIPFVERHLELGNSEWLCDRHLVQRAFTGIPVWLILRRAHNEFPKRDDDHHRAITRTFLEIRTWVCRLCLLLFDREHSKIHHHTPRSLFYGFLCDGPTIHKAQAHKTEQGHELRDQQPLEPNCFHCAITHGVTLHVLLPSCSNHAPG